jgi:hypothetical protein
MKTAIASPDGPDKKNFGIPKKDKKGLAKKTEYKYTSESISKEDSKNKHKRQAMELAKKKNPKPTPELKGHSELSKGDPSKRERDLSLNKPPKSREEARNISKQRTKDPQFEKSYKVVPNKLKTKEDLNKKAPSTKRDKK